MRTRVSARRVHGATGLLALVTIVAFWCATVLVELFGDSAAVADVKTGIARGLLLLIPLLAITGTSGLAVSGANRRTMVERKLRRMRIIAGNGLLVLVPSAVFLAWKANAGEFGTLFIVVQGAELAAGAVNAALLVLNIRDGWRLSGRFRSGRARSVTT